MCFWRVPWVNFVHFNHLLLKSAKTLPSIKIFSMYYLIVHKQNKLLLLSLGRWLQNHVQDEMSGDGEDCRIQYVAWSVEDWDTMWQLLFCYTIVLIFCTDIYMQPEVAFTLTFYFTTLLTVLVSYFYQTHPIPPPPVPIFTTFSEVARIRTRPKLTWCQQCI